MIYSLLCYSGIMLLEYYVTRLFSWQDQRHAFGASWTPKIYNRRRSRITSHPFAWYCISETESLSCYMYICRGVYHSIIWLGSSYQIRPLMCELIGCLVIRYGVSYKIMSGSIKVRHMNFECEFLWGAAYNANPTINRFLYDCRLYYAEAMTYKSLQQYVNYMLQ